MTGSRNPKRARTRAGRPLRVGLFGLLGSGNLGNDGSAQAVLAHLRERHPDMQVGFFTTSAEEVSERYGVTATEMQWVDGHIGTATGARAAALKLFGKFIAPLWTLAWIHGYDVVIVPGMGVLEATLPLRPWGFPFSLLLLSLAGGLTGTTVAMVSVGADVINKRATRLMIAQAARLARYRSYRDDLSREAMRTMGVDVATDEVFTDLAFALPAPPEVHPVPRAVAVGLMEFHGGNDDRARATEIRRAYAETMKNFVCWLLDEGHQVRLLIGDHQDGSVVDEVRTDVLARRPGLEPGRLVAEPVTDLDDLMRQMSSVETVVATRYHNVLCALKLAIPTISISYAKKNDALMANMGLGEEFCQPAQAIDFELLTKQFLLLESRRDELAETIRRRGEAITEKVQEQFEALSALLTSRAARMSPTQTTTPSQEVR